MGFWGSTDEVESPEFRNDGERNYFETHGYSAPIIADNATQLSLRERISEMEEIAESTTDDAFYAQLIHEIGYLEGVLPSLPKEI